MKTLRKQFVPLPDDSGVIDLSSVIFISGISTHPSIDEAGSHKTHFKLLTESRTFQYTVYHNEDIDKEFKELYEIILNNWMKVKTVK